MQDKRARLIVRNMPFNITENELKALFAMNGPVIDVKIPAKKGGRVGEVLGFAFVHFAKVNDATKVELHS